MGEWVSERVNELVIPSLPEDTALLFELLLAVKCNWCCNCNFCCSSASRNFSFSLRKIACS